MDRLEAMAILLRVVERGSFTAASRELRLPLATVSRKVGELETHLGTRLLARTTRRLSLTDAGATYIAAAKRILEDVDETEKAAAGEFNAPRGELVLTAPVLLGRLHVLPVVAAFLAAYPEINVRLLLSDRNLHLIEDQVDIATRIGALPDSDLSATRIGSMRTVVCASPKLLAAHGIPKSPADLTRVPCVNFNALSSSATWRFSKKREAKALDIPITTRLAVSTAEAAVSAAIASVGVTRVLHYQCADAVRDGSLRIVLERYEIEPLPVHVLHARRTTLPTKTRVFLDFAVASLRARLASL